MLGCPERGRSTRRTFALRSRYAMLRTIKHYLLSLFASDSKKFKGLHRTAHE